jgi:hypothetical protein
VLAPLPAAIQPDPAGRDRERVMLAGNRSFPLVALLATIGQRHEPGFWYNPLIRAPPVLASALPSPKARSSRSPGIAPTQRETQDHIRSAATLKRVRAIDAILISRLQ